MKILNISSLNLVPVGSGGARVIFGAIQDLAISNEVTILCQNKSKDIELKTNKIKIISNLPKFSPIKFSPFVLISIIQAIIATKPNLIIFDFPWFGVYGYIIKIIFNIPFDIREHNVEYLRFKRLNKIWWPILKIYEKFVYSECRKIRYISNLDKEIIQNELKVSKSKFISSPYRADHTVFFPNPKAGVAIRKKHNLVGKKIVLFFGSLDYQPNKEAINIIINNIAPNVWKKNKNIIFLIVGKSPPKTTIKNILFTGYVEKVEDYINASDLVIVPLISGGGIRTKIVESIACKKHVLTTQIGSEGLINNIRVTTSEINNFSKQLIKIVINKK